MVATTAGRAAGLVWDGHLGFDPRVDADLERLERWRTAGVSYLSINVGYDVMPWEEVIRVIAAYRAWIDAHADECVLVERVQEIESVRAAGRLALSFDLEGMGALDGRIEMLALYHRLGVRQVGLAYNRNNAFAGGCHDEDVGLTALGRGAVGEMNRVGIVVDCSHASYRSTMEAMELSTAPVVFSHSNPAGVWAHGRNIRDDQILACAATGGVIGVNGIGLFLGPNDVRTETIVRHIAYVAELAGPAHVGIGLDATFGDDSETLLAAAPYYWPPGNGYDTPDPRSAEPEQLPEIALHLADRGFSAAEVRGIMGENLLRVARAAWRPPTRDPA